MGSLHLFITGKHGQLDEKILPTLLVRSMRMSFWPLQAQADLGSV